MDARTAAALHHHLRVALSVEDAKEILGFPPYYAPSPTEITKAWRALSVQHHPDRGGDHKKMVEINVAKEVLEGKDSHPHYVRVDNDPAAKKRQEELRANIAAIQAEMTVCSRLAKSALDEVEGIFLPRWRVDVHEFLTHTFADAVDLIHRTAEHVSKTNEKPAEKATAQRVEALCTTLSSMGLRLGSRYGAVKKAFETAQTRPCVDTIQASAVVSSDFATMFAKLYAESGKLMTLLNSPEGMVIPFDTVEVYSDEHQRIIQYKEELLRFTRKAEAAASAQIERSVKKVEAVLHEYGAGHGFPDWKGWAVPDEFQKAIEAIGKASTTPKNATLVDRVVRRYLAGS